MSSHSENGDEESFVSYDASFHEEALRYMKSTGFMAQIKGEISKYLFDTVKTRLTSYIIQDRADKEILSQIYDYLQWVGMKSTAGVLLSESPVELTPTERNNDDESPPPLVTMFGRQKDDNKSSNLNNKSSNLDKKLSNQDADSTFDEKPPPEDKTIEKLTDETFILQETELKSSKEVDVEITPPIVNKHLLPPSADLLTGSPLSTPVSSSITKLPIRPQKPEQESTPGDKFPLNSTSTKKKESFEDLLSAYVGSNENTLLEETPTKSDKTLHGDESSLFKTPVGVVPSKPSSDRNLIAFTTSTPITDWDDQQKTPLSSTDNKTFTILKSGGERSFFSKQQVPQDDDDDQSPESSWSSASISLPKKSELEESPLPPPPPPQVEKSSPIPPPTEDGDEDDGKKSAAETTSDVVSLDLEVDNDDVTQDFSLPTDNAIGMSECDHFVNIIK